MVTKEIVTTTVEEREYSAEDIRNALCLPPGAMLYVDVPGGGDWSNTSLSLDQHPLHVVIKTKETARG